MQQRRQEREDPSHATAGGYHEAEPQLQRGYGYTNAQVRQVAKMAWQSVNFQLKPSINYSQSRHGLHTAFKRLQPVVPLPDDTWYKTVFRNYDLNDDGLIEFAAFLDIIWQYHNHHTLRNQRKAMEVMHTSSSRKRPTDSPGMSTAQESSSNDTSKEKVSNGESKGERKTNANEKVVLKSSFMFPAHKGVCQIYKDYEFKNATGKGSFGKVEVVIHRKTQRKRACKSIVVACPEQWELIKQEICLMKQLNHPNILRLHETYHDGYTIYLIMELCTGGQLFDRIVHHYEYLRQPITEQQVACWMKQILSSMAYCHEQKMVHRDIKPENILFVNETESSPLKIIDFGLSSTMDKIRSTQREVVERRTGVSGLMARIMPKVNGKPLMNYNVRRVRMQRAGTPHYMAPEMIRGHYDELVDVFSAGVIMYQLLSGFHPFYVPGVDTEETVKQKILTDEPKTTGDAWMCVSNNAKDLCRQMLQKNPKKRISSSEAANHIWFSQIASAPSGTSQLTFSVFDGLKHWQNQNKLKQAVLQLLAKELSENEISDLRKKFVALDKQQDGTITMDELRQAMVQAGYNMSEEDVVRLFESLSYSGVNRIGYNEFISALLAKRMQFQEAHLREVFDKFDSEGHGYITLDSLRQALKASRCGTLTEDELNAIFKEIDKNNDGYFDFYEFLELMTQ